MVRSRSFVIGVLLASFSIFAGAIPAGAAELVVPLSEPEPYVPSADMPVDYQIVSAVVTIGGSDVVPMGVQSKVDDPGALPEQTGDLTGGGCKQVWARIDYKNSRGDTIMYYKQTKDWCWNNRNTITSLGVVPSGHVYAWADPVWNYDGTIGSVSYYYNSNKSHYSFREGKFTAHCGPWTCGSKTPEIIIRAHGGGTWTYWTRG